MKLLESIISYAVEIVKNPTIEALWNNLITKKHLLNADIHFNPQGKMFWISWEIRDTIL